MAKKSGHPPPQAAAARAPPPPPPPLPPWGPREGFGFIVGLFLGLLFILVATFNSKEYAALRRTPAPEAHAGDRRRPPAASASCDWSSGRWVFDGATRPLYSEKACKYMSDQAACEKYGRGDLRYQGWRWEPHGAGCELPRFDAARLLERLSGKRMVFVGDSLNRNQWVSMVCLLGASLNASLTAMESNVVGGSSSLMSFKAKEYNASIEFYWSPLLVESNSDDPVRHRREDRVVRATSIEKHARYWSGADVLVFNSYLWWRRAKMNVLWGSFEEGAAGTSKAIDMLRSYEMALRTWTEWLEFNVDPVKTRVFFVTMSPTHQTGDEREDGSEKNCYEATEPISGVLEEGHRERELDFGMATEVEAAVEGLRRRSGIVVQVVNVTRLSRYRKDGHPSVHRKQWEPLSEEQIANPRSYADCIHWCLPGVPDVWNELLYAYIFS